MLLSREINGKKVIYRACDDPKNGIIVDVEKEKLKGCIPIAIHRGKLLYSNYWLEEATPINLSPNIIDVKCGDLTIFANDDSPVVYFCPHDRNSFSLFVLDTTTMEILSIKLPERMNYSTYHYYFIVGVHEGEITVSRSSTTTKVGNKWETTHEICKAKFPEILKKLERAAVERDRTREKKRKEEEKIFEEVTITNSKLPQSKGIDTVPGDPKPDFISRFTEEFKLIRELGRGAFGCVVEAENFVDECKYAVKRIAIPHKSSEYSVQKKLREVRAMAKFSHPNIVRYYGSWIERPPKIPFQDHSIFLYIQMELCIHSLEDFLRETQNEYRYPQKMRVLFKQLVEAVAYIHEEGIIHRDLKPSNILFNEKGDIRVCDLGIAAEIAINTIEGEEISETRTIIGTPLYKSPEQNYWSYTSKVDVFALGLIYAEMSMKMTKEVRRKVFDNYRKGLSNDSIVIHDKETRELINLMTKVEREDRPTSREILERMSRK
ncbi:hypothetical protein PFISCL1PPCAC_9170 [Pristionchus fissidentatus]|uniref:Protein kinase domain-containing protein n=1 Tax=Pristionchus fissidentatus TaxID=1538716 RepID=A0AAV5VET8_9BILA|nr:hypothetical protein PFISCL1PPCAC_9170 [Pristionchus fissidentatus]